MLETRAAHIPHVVGFVRETQTEFGRARPTRFDADPPSELSQATPLQLCVDMSEL